MKLVYIVELTPGQILIWCIDEIINALEVLNVPVFFLSNCLQHMLHFTGVGLFQHGLKTMNFCRRLNKYKWYFEQKNPIRTIRMGHLYPGNAAMALIETIRCQT